jgi:hypothetical protein
VSAPEPATPYVPVVIGRTRYGWMRHIQATPFATFCGARLAHSLRLLDLSVIPSESMLCEHCRKAVLALPEAKEAAA